MEEIKHPLTDPHGFELEGKEALRLAKRMRMSNPAKLDLTRISEMRAGMLPDAAALLHVLLGKLQPSKLVFSSWGIREGRLYDRLDSAARSQDPLLAGVASFAAPRGGPATLATQIAGWTVDALPKNGKGSERVRLAATMLALASMQIEPNLRVRQAINWALYKRWMDLDDGGRAMLAAALLRLCAEKLALPRYVVALIFEDHPRFEFHHTLQTGASLIARRTLSYSERATGRRVALFAAEHGFDELHAAAIGLDPEREAVLGVAAGSEEQPHLVAVLFLLGGVDADQDVDDADLVEILGDVGRLGGGRLGALAVGLGGGQQRQIELEGDGAQVDVDALGVFDVVVGPALGRARRLSSSSPIPQTGDKP